MSTSSHAAAHPRAVDAIEDVNSASTARVLSGITPSGSLTLGNYLGALRRFVTAQQEDVCFFFVADLHAMTTRHDPRRLHQLTRETAALFLAAGLEEGRATVFVQSQVPAHVELAYLLECTAHVGELKRMIQFKEKGDRPGTRASLFTYPCLMAADILLYDTAHVPVGGDQDQHVELCRDLALRFNRTYGETFVVPKLARAAVAARIADLAAPKVKMSKSAPESAPGVIRMLDDPPTISRKIGRARTDSESEVRYDPVAKPGVSNLLAILAAVLDSTPTAQARSCSSYGQLKQVCAEAVIDTLRPIQRRFDALLAAPELLQEVLRAGATRASAEAEPVLARAKLALGIA